MQGVKHTEWHYMTVLPPAKLSCSIAQALPGSLPILPSVDPELLPFASHMIHVSKESGVVSRGVCRKQGLNSKGAICTHCMGLGSLMYPTFPYILSSSG